MYWRYRYILDIFVVIICQICVWLFRYIIYVPTTTKTTLYLLKNFNVYNRISIKMLTIDKIKLKINNSEEMNQHFTLVTTPFRSSKSLNIN